MQISSAKDLIAYQKADALAMDIFHLTKCFPPEERFALISQIRRSSRSICLNFREAWAKRRYESHFISKLTDCVAESNETDTALDFAKSWLHCFRRPRAAGWYLLRSPPDYWGDACQPNAIPSERKLISVLSVLCLLGRRAA